MYGFRGQGSRRRREQGNVLAFVTIALIALLALAAFALETGQAWSAKTQLQSATDAAALAGAGSLLVDEGQAADPAAALAAVQSYGPRHSVVGEAVSIRAADVATGSWDLATRTFTPRPGSTDSDEVRAVRVVGRRDSTQNGELPTFLGRILGIDGIPIAANAIGYIGFAGVIPPDTTALPIAIDCCAIAGNTPGMLCQEDFCQTVAQNPPNPCPLDRDPSKTVSCLQFQATGVQNACWTAFGEDHPAVSASMLRDIVLDRNDRPIGARPIYLDNGTKTPIVDFVNDRFLGRGRFSGEPSGQDTTGDGQIDSWVITLPVVECQNPGAQCAQGDPAAVVGVVCFDLQEVVVTPDKIIKGEFLCPSDPRFERCERSGFGPGGTVNTGLDAQAPVLVR